MPAVCVVQDTSLFSASLGHLMLQMLFEPCLSKGYEALTRFMNPVDPDGKLPGADGGSDEGKDL